MNTCFTGERNLQSPQPTARQKYSDEGWYKPETFSQHGISTDIATILANKANHGLAMSSWKSYASAINNIKKCNEDLQCNLELPFNTKDTLNFIGWLLSKNLKSSTAKKYLSGVRQWHLSNGWDEPLLRSPLVKQVLEGATNFDALKEMPPTKNRLPITITAMKLIKRLLNKLQWTDERKSRVWFTACLAWAGSFRIHEILSREKKKFDPVTTLIGRRFKLKTSTIQGTKTEILIVRLKCPKEDKTGKGVTLEMFRDDTFMCPVQAWYNWRSKSIFPLDSEKPVVREASGVAYTGAAFQKDLHTIIGPTMERMGKGKMTTHSFRAGKASELSKHGFSEKEIKRVG